MKKMMLTIPEACHENWDAMTPVQKGKFCGSCQKEVIDFTNMSDAQLVAFFKKPSTGSVCGRFMDGQLDRSIDLPRKRIPWIKYFFQFAIPAFLFSMKATAQGKPRVVVVDTTRPVIETPQVELVGKITVKQQPGINGKVIDEKGEPVAFSSIRIKNTPVGLAADSSGRFRITGPFVFSGTYLVISSAGFQEKEIFVEAFPDLYKELVIQLTALPPLQEVTVVSFGIIRMGGAMSKVVKSESFFTPEKPKERASDLNIFPNPASSGGSVTIDCKKLEEGDYTLQLLTTGGQLISTKTIRLDKKTGRVKLDIPTVATGTYFIQLHNKAVEKSQSARIIIQ